MATVTDFPMQTIHVSSEFMDRSLELIRTKSIQKCKVLKVEKPERLGRITVSCDDIRVSYLVEGIKKDVFTTFMDVQDLYRILPVSIKETVDCKRTRSDVLISDTGKAWVMHYIPSDDNTSHVIPSSAFITKYIAISDGKRTLRKMSNFSDHELKNIVVKFKNADMNFTAINSLMKRDIIRNEPLLLQWG